MANKEKMKARRFRSFRVWGIGFVAAALMASTLFVSSAEKPSLVEVVPSELDVRVAGGVLKGGTIPAQPGSGAPTSQSAAQYLVRSRAVNATQTKALQSLQSEAGSRLTLNKPANGTRGIG